MSIVIFGDAFSFPDGQAATNRVYTYAKGFKENGINAHVVVFLNVYTNEDEGVIDGIYFYHPFRQKKRSNSFLIRRWRNLLKYFRTYYLLRRIDKEDKITAINCWTNFFLTYLTSWVLCKLLDAKLIVECSEHPLRAYQNGLLKKIQGRISLYIKSKLCDGILCISRYLIKFYVNRGVPEKKLLLVPSTVDPCRFSLLNKRPIAERYVGYFGSLTFKRDNVDLLIKAFANFNKQYPEIYLVLGGFCSQFEKSQIISLINQLNIEARVNLIDYLDRQKILGYITNADILVMTRSKDLESNASYPSKLTEFLATGRPVITVNVGEISDFLKDGENAFLTEPGNVQVLTDKLLFVFNNYEKCLQIAQKGKELTNSIFNYNYQSQRIINFIFSLQ